MTKRQRVLRVLTGMFMILLGLAMFLIPDQGYLVVLATVSVSMIFRGMRRIIYYITMARYMVGGQMILIEGLIFLDLGVFTYSLNDIPKAYIVIYLVFGLIFAGVIDVLRAFEAKKLQAPAWKHSMLHGAVLILIPLFSLIVSRSMKPLIYAFIVSMLWSGVTRISSAFRKTAIPYIQ